MSFLRLARWLQRPLHTGTRRLRDANVHKFLTPLWGLIPDNVSNEDLGAFHTMVQPIVPSDQFVLCTTFDAAGNVTAVSKKYPKMSFLKDNSLFPRDLRKVDTSLIDVVPLIMVRPGKAIIINLLHIKAIIQRDNVKVFDTANPKMALKLGIFMYDLEMKLKGPGLAPYEFKALESILISVLSYLEAQLHAQKSSCGLILLELEDHISRENLQQLLIKLKNLTSFFQRAALIRDVLEELLENDEDMTGMYLTAKQEYTLEVSPNDFSDVEMILETYYTHCDEVVQQAGSLISDIKATEEIANIILDANRNSLMLFELKVTIYTLGFTVATLVPAFYGMNLKNYIEESYYGFGAVVVLSIIQGLLITAWNFKKLHRVQKLTMMDHTPTPSVKPSYYYSSSWKRKRWWQQLLFGGKTKYHRPTNKERDVIWRMLSDDKLPK